MCSMQTDRAVVIANGKKGRQGHRHRLWIGAAAVVCLMMGQAWAGAGRGVLPLNGRAVFCLYYWLSGESMDDRDLEEFSRGLGRPTYTDYKPSEMFTRKSLRQLRSALQETMDRFHEDLLFVVTTRATQVDPQQLLPAPTPFIRARLSAGGHQKISKLLHRASAGGAGRGRVAIYFRPVGIRRAPQHRNIALEEVSLPIRLVVMEPVDARLLGPGKEPAPPAG